MKVHFGGHSFGLLDVIARKPRGEVLSGRHQCNGDSHFYALIKLFFAPRKPNGQIVFNVDGSHHRPRINEQIPIPYKLKDEELRAYGKSYRTQ